MDLLSKLYVIAAFCILVWTLATAWAATTEAIAKKRLDRYLKREEIAKLLREKEARDET